MDEDEELYREMDEEDDFYMGDKTDNNLTNNKQYNSAQNNSGCLTLIALFVIPITLTFILLLKNTLI